MVLTILIRGLGLQETQGASLTYIFGAEVRGHDQDRVAEVHNIALSIRQPAVVQDLKQGIPDFRMGLLDLVEQDDTVRTPADGFC